MDRTRFIVAGSFIDGSGAEVSRNVYLAVKDGIITGIGPAAGLPSNDGAVIDDLSHCTIVPALVDCSVSLLRSPSVDMVAEVPIHIREILFPCLALLEICLSFRITIATSAP